LVFLCPYFLNKYKHWIEGGKDSRLSVTFTKRLLVHSFTVHCVCTSMMNKNDRRRGKKISLSQNKNNERGKRVVTIFSLSSRILFHSFPLPRPWCMKYKRILDLWVLNSLFVYSWDCFCWFQIKSSKRQMTRRRRRINREDGTRCFLQSTNHIQRKPELIRKMLLGPLSIS